MNAHAPHPLTAEIAEHLLDGHPIARRHAHGLAERLAAAPPQPFRASSPARSAAVAAFLAVPGAHLTPDLGEPHDEVRSRRETAHPQGGGDRRGGRLGRRGRVGRFHRRAAQPTVSEQPRQPLRRPDHTRGPNATPSPSLIGLCTAYLAGAGAEHGNALQNPAFTALITAAGGPDKVDAYCTGLGVTAPGSNHASPTAHPTGEPSHPNPTSKPPHPTGAPTSHPAP